MRVLYLAILIVLSHIASAFAQPKEKATEPDVASKTPAKAKKGRATQPAKRRTSAKQLREHNAETLANLNKDLPKRGFSWEHIVIHHTASEWSSLARIDSYHRQKFDDPDGIEYHFLIGNGKKRPEGYIELGRWKLQKRSIHLFKPEGAPNAITISLVGNLHERKIRPAQYDALKALVVELAKTYKIPPDKITTHTRVDGRLTVCPGKHFPYKRLMKDVRKELAPKEGESSK